ncbi:hypothetical protein [Haliangium sp.]|uniref:hypothetical protein n=1 Tax=Haliangium sp. TaxID=2663208 RepID=UPI003D0B3E17
MKRLVSPVPVPAAAVLAFTVSALVTLAPAPAAADLLTLYAEAHGGGAFGDGLGGEAQRDAFHAGAQGLTYGGIVGAEVLFVDLWVQHDQYNRDGELAGTWTQFMLGLDTQFDIGKKRKGRGTDRFSAGYGELGFAVGFGVGTGQQVIPPLDNAQVTDKGFLGQISLGFGYRFNRVLSLGVSLPVQVGYMFKSGDGRAANDTGNQYYGAQGAALINLRLTAPIR